MYTWFPGHMARALREMKAKAKFADLVLEVRDARVRRCSAAVLSCPCPACGRVPSAGAAAADRPAPLQAPASTANRELENVIKCKRRLVVLNKADLADPWKTQVGTGRMPCRHR
jgi:ribosome biogenesis GTPase A